MDIHKRMLDAVAAALLGKESGSRFSYDPEALPRLADALREEVEKKRERVRVLASVLDVVRGVHAFKLGSVRPDVDGAYFVDKLDRDNVVDALKIADMPGLSATMGQPHLIEGAFQSDKYPTTPRGKVPLSTHDPDAQDLLWEYAVRHRLRDPQFSDDLMTALKNSGFKEPPIYDAEKECATCAAKPGTVELCAVCLHNRALVSRLKMDRRRLEAARGEDVNDARFRSLLAEVIDPVTSHPVGSDGSAMRLAQVIGEAHKRFERAMQAVLDNDIDSVDDVKRCLSLALGRLAGNWDMLRAFTKSRTDTAGYSEDPRPATEERGGRNGP
jgi:hypothetical protein